MSNNNQQHHPAIQKIMAFFEDTKRMRKIKIGSFGFVGIVIIISFFVKAHGHFEFEEIPAFYSILGFVACIFIVAFSKTLGKIWLEKKEDYYE